MVAAKDGPRRILRRRINVYFTNYDVRLALIFGANKRTKKHKRIPLRELPAFARRVDVLKLCDEIVRVYRKPKAGGGHREISVPGILNTARSLILKKLVTLARCRIPENAFYTGNGGIEAALAEIVKAVGESRIKWLAEYDVRDFYGSFDANAVVEGLHELIPIDRRVIRHTALASQMNYSDQSREQRRKIRRKRRQRNRRENRRTRATNETSNPGTTAGESPPPIREGPRPRVEAKPSATTRRGNSDRNTPAGATSVSPNASENTGFVDCPTSLCSLGYRGSVKSNRTARKVRRGLPQGFPASPYVAELLVAPALAGHGTTYADNIFGVGATLAEARENEERLAAILRDHPAGLFSLKPPGVRRLDWGADILGVRVRKRRGVVTVAPTKDAAKKFKLETWTKPALARRAGRKINKAKLKRMGLGMARSMPISDELMWHLEGIVEHRPDMLARCRPKQVRIRKDFALNSIELRHHYGFLG